jgi:hypothetical protein
MTDLSPAAKAVLKAACIHHGLFNEEIVQRRRMVAASLRAAADQVVPEEQRPPRRGVRPGGTDALTPEEGAENQRAATRRRLLAIAAELEGNHTSEND